LFQAVPSCTLFAVSTKTVSAVPSSLTFSPHSLQGLGSSPVLSQHYPENRNFVNRQRDSRRGFSPSGCLHHYRGTQGGTKLRRKNACVASDSKSRATSYCYGPCLSPAEIKSPVFCAFPWWCWRIWAGILRAGERAITATHQRARRAMRVYKRQYLLLFIQQSEKSFIFLILRFRRVLYVICFLLCNSPASQY